MKYFITAIFLFCFLISSSVIIKDKEPGILEIEYVKTQVVDTLKWESYSDPMTLRIGQTSAMFYPTKKMWADSLLKTNFKLHEKIYYETNPIGKPGFTPIGGYEDEYLFRNVNEGETMVCSSIGGDVYYYVEDTTKPEWEIREDTKEILGYQCQRAECDFRGRNWVAWFTPEIPVQEGPWKLIGLPGLILAANDSKNHYSYEATSILTQELRPVGIRLYVNDLYNIKSRRKYLQRIYKEYIKGKFVARMSTMHGNGSQSTPVEGHYDSQETDYPHE